MHNSDSQISQRRDKHIVFKYVIGLIRIDSVENPGLQ